MKVKVLLIAMVIFGCGAAFMSNQSEAAAAPFTMTADPATTQHISQSTVQIAMYEYDNSGGRGLGTVVWHNGQTAIITHDHWSHLNGNLNVVEFSSAMGELLLVLNAAEFQSLIQYRDGGAMVLAVPAGLTGFVPASLAGTAAVKAGDTVWMARRTPVGDRNTVEVIGAMVDGVKDGNGPAYLQMRGSGNAVVIPGDSGGGVWVNGQLVANVWSGGVVVSQGWFDKLVGSEQVSGTNSINAALNPLGGIGMDVEVVEETAVTPLEGKLFR